jgi:hypothetical protein
MFSLRSARDHIRRNERMPLDPPSPGDCSLRPDLTMKRPFITALGARDTGGGIIDPVSAFDFQATEFRSHDTAKVAFAIKASQHLL